MHTYHASMLRCAHMICYPHRIAHTCVRSTQHVHAMYVHMHVRRASSSPHVHASIACRECACKTSFDCPSSKGCPATSPHAQASNTTTICSSGSCGLENMAPGLQSNPHSRHCDADPELALLPRFVKNEVFFATRTLFWK